MEYRILDTAWGYFGLVSLRNQLISTWLPGSKKQIEHAILDRWPAALYEPELLGKFCRDVKRYFEGHTVLFDNVKIALTNMTCFRQQILEECRRVAYGEMVTYGELALRSGAQGAARAVGSAMAANPLPLVIPCHRIIRSDDKLGGFSSPLGVTEKKRLLDLEADDSFCLARSMPTRQHNRLTALGV